ncbi:MAG: hypothetical protein L6R00_14010 [Phycisphaerae bacterium]|nr:hypothetical protein [Phycisphaerae bacterium]
MIPRRVSAWLLHAALFLAVVGAVGRFCFHRPLLSAGLFLLTVAPAALAWLPHVGVFRLIRRGEAPADDRASAILSFVVLGASAALEVLRGGGAGGLAFTLFVAACVLFDAATRLLHRLDAAAGDIRQLARSSLGAWLFLSLLGTLLLTLPAATHPAIPDYGHNFWRHVSACGFMAVSATTLNGGTIYPVGEDLRPFGQAVLYALMQCSAVLYAALGLIALRPWLARPIRLGAVLMLWIALQLLAVAATRDQWKAPDDGGPRLWTAVFHSAAALNQCGFAMRQDGIGSYLLTGPIFWTMLVLSVLGSVGLIVVIDRLRAIRLLRRSSEPPADGAGAWRLLELTSNELHTGIWMLCLGAALIWACESEGLLPRPLFLDQPLDAGAQQIPLRNLTPEARWRAALLLSAGARSSGLHVAPLSQGAISLPTAVLLLMMMAAGGAVGSAAGGMRTAALGVLLYRHRFLETAATGKHREPPFGGRPAPHDIPRMLAWFIAGMIGLCGVAVVLLRVTQPAWDWWEAAVTGVSLTSGVGFTTGQTAHLTGLGRAFMILFMTAGQWAPTLFWCRMASAFPTMPQNARPARPG